MTDKKSNLSEDLQMAVNSAKAEGHVVFAVNLASVKYIYRSINRKEFRELQGLIADEAEKAKISADVSRAGLKEDDPKLAEIDAQLEKAAISIRENGEERLVKAGLIHPALGENTPAGVSTTIADRIMEASAFGSEEEPEML
tara:strand:+ start:74909 stop:75334 length:426 start_codon:yes stop_codon:yes gene_type:complete